MAWYSFLTAPFLRDVAPVALLDTGPPVDARPVEKRVAPTAALGTSGTAVYGGFPDTRERSPDLQGVERYRRFDELKYNVAVVAAAVRRTLMLVKGTTWRVEAAPDSGTEGDRIAEAMHTLLLAPRALGRPFAKVAARQFMSVYDGAAISEWIAVRRDDGLVGFRDIQPRPIHTITRWNVQRDGTLLGCWQTSPWDSSEIYLPREKFVYTVDADLTDSPDGTGLLRHCAEAARQLQHLEKIEGWQFETDLGGVPKVYAPVSEMDALVKSGELTASDRDRHLKGIRDFVSKRAITPGRGLILDGALMRDPTTQALTQTRMWDVELLNTEIGGFGPLSNAVDRKMRQIAWVLGIEGLLLGGDGRGTYALAKDKTAALVQLITSGMDDVADALNHDLVSVLMALNGWSKELQPRLIPAAIQLADVEAIVAGLEGIARAGIDPRDPVHDEIRAMLGVSPYPEELLDEAEEMAAMGRAGMQAAQDATSATEGDVEIDTDDLDQEEA